ncbi:hypothetical protein GCM10022232_64400 [Streptomyces plumbiresistens]|uniref:CoA transferase n=1 Tax=Streptomyces plumbiresistens TaxID=511811 RepID=A0ABP7SLT9_9ACTN
MTATTESAEPGPAFLRGVRVLDVTGALAGPYCTTILSDLGADVLKVEPVTGDRMRARRMGPDRRPIPFDLTHRDKGSLAVDMKSAEGADIVRSLARRSDVLVENFRAGAMAQLELDMDTVDDLADPGAVEGTIVPKPPEPDLRYATQVRRYVPARGARRFAGLHEHTARTFAEALLRIPVLAEVVRAWRESAGEPYVGITTDGRVRHGVYELGLAPDVERPPTEAMLRVVEEIRRCTTQEPWQRLTYPLNAPQRRGWSNPEVLVFDNGLRLEELSELSEDGYTLVCHLMRLNGFLGEVVGMTGVMNPGSYQFAILGESPLEQPPGWHLHGHHVCVNALVAGAQMAMNPVFLGAEPDSADVGSEAGATAGCPRTGRADFHRHPDSAKTLRGPQPPGTDPAGMAAPACAICGGAASRGCVPGQPCGPRRGYLCRRTGRRAVAADRHRAAQRPATRRPTGRPHARDAGASSPGDVPDVDRWHR